MTVRDRRLTSAALALAGALVLGACGGGADDTTASGTESGSHGGDHGADTAPSPTTAAPSPTTAAPSPTTAAQGNDADIRFLTEMAPHHEQAVAMSDMVLAADPPAPVVELARRVKAAQAPEIEQMEQMLADLGQPGATGEAGHAGGHGGMMSDADLAALRDATGTDAARIYLEGMVEHHRGAIEAAETQVADGQYPPAVELARQIAQDQAAEIGELEAVLASL
jgi:uncharacterized protein (DUF305 family)